MTDYLLNNKNVMKTLYSKLNMLIIIALVAVIMSSCKKDDTGTKSVTLISDADNDGYVANSTPRMVNSAGASIIVGWTSGISSRGFVSFDITDIKPSGDKNMVIEKATLRIHQKDYNFLPFTGNYDGIMRVAEAYLVNYGTLDQADYSLAAISNCGVLASAQLPFHGEASLDVTEYVADYLTEASGVSNIQFRIQFTNDSNTENNSLGKARWYLFPGEDPDDEDYMDLKPALEVTFHYL